MLYFRQVANKRNSVQKFLISELFCTESNVFILFTPNWLISYFFCRVRSVTASQWLVGKAEVIWGLATTGKCVYIVPYIYWIILEYNSLRRGAQKGPSSLIYVIFLTSLLGSTSNKAWKSLNNNVPTNDIYHFILFQIIIKTCRRSDNYINCIHVIIPSCLFFYIGYATSCLNSCFKTRFKQAFISRTFLSTYIHPVQSSVPHMLLSILSET